MLKQVRGLTLGLISFVYLIFFLNPIQILSAPIYLFSRRLFRRINRWCARSCWGMWVLLAERVNGIEIRFCGDELPRRENALLLPNHQSMVDVMILISLGWRCGRLGDMKWFVKDPIKYIPGPGWGMKFLDCVYVKRDWTRDRAGIERLFAKYRREDIPVFLVSFLEGTRLTADKQAEARAFARSRGTYVPHRTLVPRTKGFVATMHGLRSHLDAVYDITIGYPDRTPTLLECFAAKVDRIDVHVRRYAIDTLPDDDDALSEWVFRRFEEKDRRMVAFADHARFPEPTVGVRVAWRQWFTSERRRPPLASAAQHPDAR